MSDTANPTRSATPPIDSVLSTDSRAGVGLLVLRLVTGVVLLVHGVQNGSDPAGHIAATEQLGVPLAPVTGVLSLLGEVGLGVLLIVGLLVRLAGALAAVLMGVTWLVTITPDGLFTDAPGINTEQGLLLAAAGVAFACLGGGRYGLDAVALTPLRRLVGLDRTR